VTNRICLDFQIGFARKHGAEHDPPAELPDPEKEALNCYNSAACDGDNTDLVMVQSLPMLVQIT
jgi:hypothetical protein